MNLLKKKNCCKHFKLSNLILLACFLSFFGCNIEDDNDLIEEAQIPLEQKGPRFEQGPIKIDLSMNFGKTHVAGGYQFASFFIKLEKQLPKSLRIVVDYKVNNQIVLPIRPEFHIATGKTRSETIYNVSAGSFDSYSCTGDKSVTIKISKVYYGNNLISKDKYDILPVNGETNLTLVTSCQTFQNPEFKRDFDFDGVADIDDDCKYDYGTNSNGCPL